MGVGRKRVWVKVSADDIGWASTAEHIIGNIEKTTTEKLKERNLLINQSKTEKYNIKKDGDESWKKM